MKNRFFSQNVFYLLFLGISIFYACAGHKSYDYNEGIEVLTNELVANRAIPTDSRIAVVGFINPTNRKEAPISNNISNDIERELLKHQYVLLDRQNINRAIEEQKKGSDFYYDQASVANIGSLLGAGHVVYGTFTDWSDSWIKLDAKCISVKTGALIASASTFVSKRSLNQDLLKVEKKGIDEKAEFEPTFVYYSVKGQSSNEKIEISDTIIGALTQHLQPSRASTADKQPQYSPKTSSSTSLT